MWALKDYQGQGKGTFNGGAGQCGACGVRVKGVVGAGQGSLQWGFKAVCGFVGCGSSGPKGCGGRAGAPAMGVQGSVEVCGVRTFGVVREGPGISAQNQ